MIGPSIQENDQTLENTQVEVSDTDMKFYEQRFQVFKSLSEGIKDKTEKSFLSSAKVFSLSMGLAADMSFPKDESSILYRQLEQKDNIQNYSLITEEENSSYGYIFLNIPIAKATLKQLSKTRDIQKNEQEIENMSIQEITDFILLLYNSEKETSNLTRGVLSGFPIEAVDEYIKTDTTTPTKRYRAANDEERLKLLTPQKATINQVFNYYKQNSSDFGNFSVLRQIITPRESNIRNEDNQKLVEFLGISFMTSKNVDRYLHRLQKIVNNLQLVKFLTQRKFTI